MFYGTLNVDMCVVLIYQCDVKLHFFMHNVNMLYVLGYFQGLEVFNVSLSFPK